MCLRAQSKSALGPTPVVCFGSGLYASLGHPGALVSTQLHSGRWQVRLKLASARAFECRGKAEAEGRRPHRRVSRGVGWSWAALSRSCVALIQPSVGLSDLCLLLSRCRAKQPHWDALGCKIRTISMKAKPQTLLIRRLC